MTSDVFCMQRKGHGNTSLDNLLLPWRMSWCTLHSSAIEISFFLLSAMILTVRVINTSKLTSRSSKAKTCPQCSAMFWNLSHLYWRLNVKDLCLCKLAVKTNKASLIVPLIVTLLQCHFLSQYCGTLFGNILALYWGQNYNESAMSISWHWWTRAKAFTTFT